MEKNLITIFTKTVSYLLLEILEGGPKRDPNIKWNYKIFREEKKNLKIDYPVDHIIDRQIVLKNLKKHKS